MNALSAGQHPLRFVPPAPRTLRLVQPDATVVLPRVEAEARTEAGPPNWISVGTHHVVDELKLYFRTMYDFGTRPHATAAAWANGSYRAINPLNYFLKTLAIITPWRAFWWSKFGLTQGSMAATIGQAYAAYFFLVLVTMAHPYFRVAGGKRPISSSWAAAMYVLGGVPTLASLVIEPLSLWSRAAMVGRSVHHFTLPGFSLRYVAGGGVLQHGTAVASGLVFILYWIHMTSAVAGVQGIARWRVAAAFVGLIATIVAVIDIFHRGSSRPASSR